MKTELIEAIIKEETWVEVDSAIVFGKINAATKILDLFETELAAKDAQIAALHEALRRYMIYENNFNGYLELSREFGGCEHPESSVWMTEWLERVLREPAKAAMLQAALQPEAVTKCPANVLNTMYVGLVAV